MRILSPFLRRGLVAGACVATAFAVHAQASPAGALPPMKGEGAARYVCGGVGLDESTALRAAMKDHPLSLLLARSDGAYLANVDVVIKNAKGDPALALQADGPVCLIDLPPGRYTVEASARDTTKRQSVTVGRGAKTVDFRF
ncbi:MAG: hypothetical protein JWQ03_2067 [Variovorax sp.]|nr:hypothetical protein [Variovorax sp.]